jgi:hypothetical protein
VNAPATVFHDAERSTIVVARVLGAPSLLAVFAAAGAAGKRRPHPHGGGEEGDVADREGTPVLDLLTGMTTASIEASSLDAQSLMVARIAALVAVDAPPVSYLMNIGAASEVDLDIDDLRGILVAIAPIVGTARVASATGKIVQALGVALEVAELEAELEAAEAE